MSQPKPTDAAKLQNEKRVGWFALGAVPDTAGPIVQTQMANMIFNIELGLSPVLLGVAHTVMRLWDAFADPFVGSWSDRAKTRWGRRRPFVFMGSVGCALTFPLIWFCPAGLSEMAIFAFYLATSLLFLTTHSIYSMPWRAWGAEFSDDYHGRTRVWGRAQAVMIVVYFIATWLYALVSSRLFASPVIGMRTVAVATGIVILVCGILPCWQLRERVRAPSSPHPDERRGVITSIGRAFQLREMRLLTACSLFLTIGLQSVGQLALYLHIFYLFHGDKAAGSILIGWSGTVAQTASFLSVPLGVWLSRRLGKRRALEVCILVTMTGIICKWWLYDPRWPYLVLVAAAMMAPVQVGLSTIMYSMLADVCDLDELRSGRRQEGLYTAVYSWVSKAALALTGVLAGVALSLTGFDAALGAAQHESTLLLMLFTLCLLPVVALAVVLVLVRLYSLDEKAVAEVQRQLAERRAVAAAAEPAADMAATER